MSHDKGCGKNVLRDDTSKNKRVYDKGCFLMPLMRVSCHYTDYYLTRKKKDLETQIRKKK